LERGACFVSCVLLFDVILEGNPRNGIRAGE